MKRSVLKGFQVASVGLIPKYLPFVTSNNAIHYFRHAIALDEHRGKFGPSFYKQSHEDEELAAQQPNEQHLRSETEETLVSSPPVTPSSIAFNKTGSQNKKPGTKNGSPKLSKEHSQAHLFERKINRESGAKTNALEVWFAGVHTGAFVRVSEYVRLFG
jgi:hypothetical protein